jgi:hypothetical protein
MPAAFRLRSFLLASTVAPFVFSSIIACQAKQPAATAAAPQIQLQPYTAPDQTASASVPSGWNVTSAGDTVIHMTGPQGEGVSLGNIVVAKNAAFQMGQKPANGIDLNMPYTSTLPQKLTMVFQQSAASTDKAVPQLTITSSTPIPLPAALGQCGRFVGNFSMPTGAMNLLAVFCSMPLDPGGTYKNVMLLAQAPVATAAQSAPAARAIFASYRIPATWLQKKLAPFQTASPGKAGPAPTGAAAIAEANAINRQTMQMMQGANNSANCFDLAVLRSTPTPLLPRSCGGNAP